MIKKYWLLFLSLLTGAVFLLSRLFLKSRPSLPNSDTNEAVDKLFTAEKARLNEEKSQLLEKEKEIENKEYTDEEIEKKYNS